MAREDGHRVREREWEGRGGAIERAESENINALINKPEEKSSEARIAPTRATCLRASARRRAGQETTVGSRTVNFGSRVPIRDDLYTNRGAGRLPSFSHRLLVLLLRYPTPETNPVQRRAPWSSAHGIPPGSVRV